MPNLNHLYSHIKKYGSRHQSLYFLSIMLFFFAIFDGIISYITPLMLTEKGFSDTAMGVIIGSSSIFGAFFDFIFCRFFKNTTYRRVFMLMFIVCFFYPLILWKAKMTWLFVVAMAIWGVYYDLYNYGTFDFVGRHTKKEEHSSSFGVIQVFKSLGAIIAPLVAGFTIISAVTFGSIMLTWLFLGISILLFIALLIQTRNEKNYYHEGECCTINSSGKILVMFKISKIIFPALIVTMMLCVVEAFFWTIGPIYASELNLGQWSGLLVMADAIPVVLFGWYVGNLTNKLGKKKTAYVTFLLGSLTLILFIYAGSSAMPAVALTFIQACFLGLSMPAISSAYADYISENPELESEIEAAEDLSVNMGYVIGPMLAGVMADALGYHNSFGLLGIAGVIIALLLLKFAPKHISIRKSQ